MTKETLIKVANKIVARKNKSTLDFKVPEGIKAMTGRRKASVARVWLIPRDNPQNRFLINNKELSSFFPLGQQESIRKKIIAPFTAVGEELSKYVVMAYVQGGGITGQVDAITLGLARNLAGISDTYRYVMRKNGFLTRDSRVVESKKSGRPKARKKKQFSKR